ncbi:TPA: ATPase [Campylobacter coli]|nr:ATPase [Campylobacter coli]HEB9331062.1 ATPase [Campylobacter coli]
MLTNNIGSTWLKWDLHVHTPYSNMNNNYNCSDDSFINEIISKQISCVGLTNYFNFKKGDYELQKKLKSKNISAFLNLELRLDYQNKEDQCLDLHIIFSDCLDEKHIIKFLANVNVHVDGAKKKLSDLDSQNDFAKAVVNFDELIKHLNDESLNMKNSYLLGFLSRGHGNARSSANYKKINKYTHFLIHSTNKLEALKNDVKHWESYEKRVLQSSDAHDLNTIGKKFTWIKAKPTFEGLRQILYEPLRVFIGENEPPKAIHKIESVELKFDENTKWGNDKFCFADFKEIIYFSPYLTCIIGGRGSGKSTLLNLIAAKIDKLDEIFFNELNPKEINSKVLFSPEEIENIEFLAQNKIEEFAKNSKEFTKAIFNRLNKNTNNLLIETEDAITKELQVFENQIDNLKNRISLHIRLKNHCKDLKKLEYIVRSFDDHEYLSSKEKIQIIEQELIKLLNSRDRVNKLLNSLNDIVTKHHIIKIENSYDSYYNDLYMKICELVASDTGEKYKDSEENINSLESEKETYIRKIKNYLESKGLTEENINDVQIATSKIENIKEEIKNIKEEIKKIKEKIKSFSHNDIDEKIKNFKSIITKQLDIVNEKFEKISENNKDELKNIKIQYPISNIDDFSDTAIEYFIEKIKHFKEIEIKDKSTFKNYLKELTIKKAYECKQHYEFKKDIDEFLKSKNTQTAKLLSEIFSKKIFFQIYQLVIAKTIRNISKNKNLEVTYDNKSLNNVSFGQRCTAAIIILVSLGNNPIIIDEPETHLDSSLIANYLVNLIKKIKMHRQIIFATHNANFVLNADAELIIELENNDNKTKANLFAIEDIDFRSKLLKLEGGKEAFKKREEKYGFNNKQL